MKISVIHPMGNQNNRAILNGLLEAEMLHSFYTSIAYFPDSRFYNLISFNSNISSEFSRREFQKDLKQYTSSYPFKEFLRLMSLKMRLNNLIKHEKGVFSVDNVYKYIDKKRSKSIAKDANNGLTGIYAYEDGAYRSFLKAKEYGLKCIYDLPIAYWETQKKLLIEESERMPLWIKTISSGIKDSDEKLLRKEEELYLSDTVVVPSKFVRTSLPDWALNKNIIEAPFGSPVSLIDYENNQNNIKKKKKDNGVLRVLFVGSMTQRKGLGDLFEAINLVDSKKVELVVLGSLVESYEFYQKQLKHGFTYERGRPHKQVLELMATCDIFCLPSIVEGRALVMQEAMSQGLPIIITPNTGGEDLVIEGETGFLVPVRSPNKIAEKINWFLENRPKISVMSKKAQSHAKTYTWANYAETIIKKLSDNCQ